VCIAILANTDSGHYCMFYCILRSYDINVCTSFTRDADLNDVVNKRTKNDKKSYVVVLLSSFF